TPHGFVVFLSCIASLESSVNSLGACCVCKIQQAHTKFFLND
ncbi:MAG: hypothetical protein ACI8VW_003812, partial [bacterium]